MTECQFSTVHEKVRSIDVSMFFLLRRRFPTLLVRSSQKFFFFFEETCGWVIENEVRVIGPWWGWEGE